MMICIVWIFMLVFSVICGAVYGTSALIGAAVMEGAQSGITLTLSIAGGICLWSGLARVMERSGLSDHLTRLLQPLLGSLFPKTRNNRPAMHALCGNFIANLLGLGNAATPLGIETVRQMREPFSDRATAEMCRFVVLNTASVQLLPTTVAAIRSANGAVHPLDILPAVWMTSISSVAVGLAAEKLLERFCDV